MQAEQLTNELLPIEQWKAILLKCMQAEQQTEHSQIQQEVASLLNCMQAEQLTKHLRIEQEKASQDRADWGKREAELLQNLSESMDNAQRLKAAQAAHEQEYSQFEVSKGHLPPAYLICSLHMLVQHECKTSVALVVVALMICDHSLMRPERQWRVPGR